MMQSQAGTSKPSLIRSTLTSIKTSSDKAKTGLNEMVDAVGAKLERIDALVAEADAGGRLETGVSED